MINAYIAGVAVGGSLIIAIGAQNATLLRVGLQRRHVGTAVAVCIIGDASLIALGIGGLGSVLLRLPGLLEVLRWLGAAYLARFAWKSFQSAWRGSEILNAASDISRSSVLITMMAVTWLNPHVYVDTVMVLGTVSTQFGARNWWFGLGAVTCSVAWFSAVGFGARFLRPLFRQPRMWRILDALVGGVVTLVALNLIMTSVG